MKVKMVPIASVKPYGRNPRKNQGAIAKVASSLREFGWRQPIVVDSEMVVVAGHTRLLAAQRLGMDQVPVHIAEGLTGEQIKAYRLTDNRSGEEAEWDRDLLKIELADLQVSGFSLDLTGFDLAELRETMLPGESKKKTSDPKLDKGLSFQVVVECEDENQQAEVLEDLRTRGIKCKPLIL